jgi:hypothetical protein
LISIELCFLIIFVYVVIITFSSFNLSQYTLILLVFVEYYMTLSSISDCVMLKGRMDDKLGRLWKEAGHNFEQSTS